MPLREALSRPHECGEPGPLSGAGFGRGGGTGPAVSGAGGGGLVASGRGAPGNSGTVAAAREGWPSRWSGRPGPRESRKTACNCPNVRTSPDFSAASLIARVD